MKAFAGKSLVGKSLAEKTLTNDWVELSEDGSEASIEQVIDDEWELL